MVWGCFLGAGLGPFVLMTESIQEVFDNFILAYKLCGNGLGMIPSYFNMTGHQTVMTQMSEFGAEELES